MRNYNKELDLLFDEWRNESSRNGLNNFCSDGLMHKGKIFQTDKGFWGREEGDENEQWSKASKRILFLTKDTNSNPDEDMRTWIGRQHPSIITSHFFKNISLWLYGLNSFQNDGSYAPFEKAIDPVVFSTAFDNLPIAIVNIKKESGGGKIPNSELWAYASIYHSFLKRQIEILDPTIIVCGGGSSSILNIVKKYIYPELEFLKTNNWIYSTRERKIVLIDSYHPTSRVSYKEIYEEMMSSYKMFLLSNQ